MLALVVLIAVVVPAGPLGVDRSWSEAMRDIETPMLTHLALVFNWLGRGFGRAIGLTIVGLLLLRRRRWLALAAFAVTESLAPMFSSLFKALIDRPRPPDGLVHAAGTSFPSGHATYAGATCVALVLLFTSPGTRRRLWWTLASLGVFAMAWSRTYLQVHWLSDVTAGALLGSGISLLIFAIAQEHQSRVIDGVFSRRSGRRRAGRTKVARTCKTRGRAATADEARSRTAPGKPAFVGPLLTFMVRRGSTVRVRQRASRCPLWRLELALRLPKPRTSVESHRSQGRPHGTWRRIGDAHCSARSRGVQSETRKEDAYEPRLAW